MTQLESNNDVANRVKMLISKHLDIDIDKVKPDSRFSDDLGADSLDRVELVMALEDEFGIEISDGDAEKILKVEDAVNYVGSQSNKAE